MLSFGAMVRPLAFFLLISSVGAPGQAPAQPATFQPHTPRDFFDSAKAAYNFDDEALGPWHLKATYQTYDADSRPAAQGTYEHWWVTPKVFRNSWTRPGASHTDWHTADGKHAYQGEGVLDYFEYALQSALFHPVPSDAELDPSRVRLEREDVTLSGVKFPCVKVIPLMPQHGRIQQIPLGLFPTYCFGEKTPVLRIEFAWKSMTTEFNNIVKVQGRYLPRELAIFEGKRKILTATVDLIEGIQPSDPALVPPTGILKAATPERIHISSGVATGLLLKKVVPVYPADARDARVTGTVVLRGVIGRDGSVHDLEVVQTPWPTLAASALWSVSQWRYRPYLFNGEPIEADTEINVIFSMR